MKKLLLFAVAVFFTVSTMAQMAGTWKVANEAGAIGVGPGQGDISWWSNSVDDLTLRACYFDDEYIFGEDGSFMNMMGDETWLEVWQGVEADGCGAPIAPHDGSNAATYEYNETEGTLTLNGVGAFLGLAKVINGGELAAPGDAPESITYLVEMSEDGSRMTVDIAIAGEGWWRFILDKAMDMPMIDVTMNVDMSGLEGFDPATHSVYVSGSVFGWPEPGTNPDLMLTRVDETLVYTISAQLAEPGEIQYKYFTDAVAPGWNGGEWEGDPNRKIYVLAETTLEDVFADKPVETTFMVDMTNAEVFDPETDAIYMAGTVNIANNWQQPGTDPSLMMTPAEDNAMMYQITLMLPAGTYFYKYFRVINGEASWNNGEWEGEPNREVAIDTLNNMISDTWGSAASINDPEAGPIASIYPNPVGNELNITFFDNNAQIRKIEVFNVTGAIVKVIQGSFAGTVRINTSDLVSGVYMIAVHSNQGIQSTKFVKE